MKCSCLIHQALFLSVVATKFPVIASAAKQSLSYLYEIAASFPATLRSRLRLTLAMTTAFAYKSAGYIIP
jgi:hypothetical protein